MTVHRAHPRQRRFPIQGFSMLEVLIAVLVFSLGMIGLAGLLIYSIQSNHVAYLRTQATFLAHNMADRMAANPAGLWTNAYGTITAPTTYPVPVTGVTCAAGCTPAALAIYDEQQWSTQLTTFLPSAGATIGCSPNGITYTPSPDKIMHRPPYGGTCVMTIWWNEASSATGIPALRTFEWKFQP